MNVLAGVLGFFLSVVALVLSIAILLAQFLHRQNAESNSGGDAKTIAARRPAGAGN